MKRHLIMMLASIVALSTIASSASAASNQPSTQVQGGSVQQDKATNAKGPTGDGLNNILTMAVAWKQTAAEYKALYHQAYNMARLQVDLALAYHRPGDKPLAIITDIDDTIILPINYWGYLINNNKDFFDDAIWDKWIPQYKMVASPGALEFFQYCKEKGVEVFYVSNRDQGQNTYEYAVTQLNKLNFPYIDNTHLTVNRETSNKEIRQNEIAQKYNVISYLGDNLNDFRRVYYVKDVDERTKLMEQDKDLYGSKFILMPNPTDGHWIRAIFGDSEPPAADQNRAIWKKAASRSSWEQK
ncbi:5'-nucleotidase, lipoprotein e(P4) family [Brevibacillus choshinensis]|uniref:5'-nucleotidase, lipoprotein e(P4) family n=1 Tax=Brevibacillus choshinensis TaxID=54911 RepID=UPI002E1B37B6|nr:5'-nucleotidase, lipoprotein e(P4) family [Brevibacillus choshinensis]MED4586747.1 5'-nucleotidase, lipoprotein e(P4) family [Brevibacillus choshinensis]